MQMKFKFLVRIFAQNFPNYALHTTAKPLRDLASLAALGACELRC